MSNETTLQTNEQTQASSDQRQASKLILRSALQKANAAVQCDSTNDVIGAISAYKEAIELLERVLSSVEKENDKQRLQSIHDSYSERIRLLSSITIIETQTIYPSEDHLEESSDRIRKMTSDSSIDSHPHSPVTFWQDNSQPKEYTPLPFQIQASKSTPTHGQKPIEGDDADDEDDSDEKEQVEYYSTPTIPTMRPPPRNSSRLVVNSPRSSVSSVDSILSEDSIVEQPPMVLPSLKPETPKIKTAFRARTSSLPKPPIQRSSSMSTVDTLASPISPSIDHEYRSITHRPLVGSGLGSIRRKTTNRLSMEGLSRKDKGNQSFRFLIKDEDTQQAPPPPQTPTHMVHQHSHLKLLFALEKSMLEGAHITQKLYIPKNLWQQPNIRLTSMDIKVSACESLLQDIQKLEAWNYLDDLISSSRLLDHFESSVDHLQVSLSKKLKRESNLAESTTQNNGLNHNIHHSHSRDSMSTMNRMDSGKKTQSFMSWGTKLTKSVEKMNAFSLTKTEDQYKNYIEVLQKFLSKMHILEYWLNHYQAEKLKSRQPQYDVLILKLIKICTIINNVIGGFIIKDITVLLAKWLKRGGSWVNE